MRVVRDESCGDAEDKGGKLDGRKHGRILAPPGTTVLLRDEAARCPRPPRVCGLRGDP
jgi:hypothetical protein